MDRKKALATATAVVLTIAAGTAALASSLGMFGLGGAVVPVGEQGSVQTPAIAPTPSPEVETVVIDVPTTSDPEEEPQSTGPSSSTESEPIESPEVSDDHGEEPEDEAEEHEGEDDHSPEPSDEHEDEDHGEDDD